MENTFSDFIDLDKWEIALSPDAYQHRFFGTLPLVQLVSHIPKRLPAIAQATNDDWMLLASSVHQIWIKAGFKYAFMRALKKRQVVQPGKHPLQACSGRILIPVKVFIDCLKRAGCQTLWIKAYGQKLPLTDQFLGIEPSFPAHPFARYNEWDIGRSFDSVFIWLWAPATGNLRDVSTFPMIIPASGDFGSVRVQVRLNSRDFTVKIYPRLVHLIKSHNSQLGATIPKTQYGVRAQGRQALQMISDLAASRLQDMDGFRIEVTVQAPTLAAAREIVDNTPFLYPEFWLDPAASYPALHFLKLNVKLIEKTGLLANANWMHSAATSAGVFSGRDSNHPVSRSIQGLVDVMASFGWNSGLRTVTRSAAKDAWWRSEAEQSTELTILAHLQKTFPSVSQQIGLLKVFRAKSTFGYIPCQLHPGNKSHRYQVQDRDRLRVRCGNKSCSHRLRSSELMRWIAKLATDGKVPLAALQFTEAPRDGVVSLLLDCFYLC